MAGLTTQRQPLDQPLSNQSFPLATSQTVYAGARIYADVVAGLVKIGASGNLNLLPLGTAQQTVTTTTATGQLLVRLDTELNCQWMDNDTGAGAITSANLFGLCYVKDDHSVTLLSGGNSVAGRVMAVGNSDSSTAVLVAFNPATALDTFPGEEAASGGSTAFTARGVAIVMHAYAGTGTGTLTSTATGTLASQVTTPGVTLAAGDVFFLPAGLTNVTAVDSGPWQVVNAGSASPATKWVITRPSWWATGSTWATSAIVKISGTDSITNNTDWKAYNAPGVIDTSDPGFYVKQFTFQVTLASGTLALTAGQPNAANQYPLSTGGTHTCPVGIVSATESNILVTLAVPGTNTGTFAFGPTNHSSSALCTAGYVGTAAAAAFATLAAMATSTSDTSTVNVTIFNP